MVIGHVIVLSQEDKKRIRVLKDRNRILIKKILDLKDSNQITVVIGSRISALNSINNQISDD